MSSAWVTFLVPNLGNQRTRNFDNIVQYECTWILYVLMVMSSLSLLDINNTFVCLGISSLRFFLVTERTFPQWLVQLFG